MIEDEDEIDTGEPLPPMTEADKAEFGMTGKPPTDDDQRQKHRRAILEMDEARRKLNSGAE